MKKEDESASDSKASGRSYRTIEMYNIWYNIKMNLRGVGDEDVDGIVMTKDRAQ
jgi:hypothetical protein